MTNLTQLDTSSLQQRISNRSVVASLWNKRIAGVGKYFRGLSVAVPLVLALLVGFAVYEAITTAKSFESMLGGIIAGLLFYFFGIAILMAYLADTFIDGRLSMYLSRLAEQNKLHYFVGDVNVDELQQVVFAPTTGVIFERGRSRLYLHVFGDKDFSIFGYTYITGSGKNSRTYRWVVSCLHLSKHLPHVVIDAKVNNFLGYSNLPELYSADQLLVSQSKFSEEFNVYIPDGAGVDALSFLTPELMEVIMQECKSADVEIIGDMLYVYTSGMVKAKNIEEHASRLKNLHVELEDNIASFGASVPRTSPLATQYALNQPVLRTNSTTKLFASLGLCIIYVVFQMIGEFPRLSIAGLIIGFSFVGFALYKLKH